jgi:hypothetical protein
MLRRMVVVKNVQNAEGKDQGCIEDEDGGARTA